MRRSSKSPASGSTHNSTTCETNWRKNSNCWTSKDGDLRPCCRPDCWTAKNALPGWSPSTPRSKPLRPPRLIASAGNPNPSGSHCKRRLREKEQALQERQAAIAELEANLNGQIQDLRNRLIEKQELLERRDHEFQNLGSETALLRERIAQLESAASEAEQIRSSGSRANPRRAPGEIGCTRSAAQRERASVSRKPSMGSRIGGSTTDPAARPANPDNRKAVASRNPQR